MKNAGLDREMKKRDKIEDEIKEKKKEQGKLSRDLTKIEQHIKEAVSTRSIINLFFLF